MSWHGTLKLHATQRGHTSMARSSVVFLMTCFWLSKFVASPSRDTMDCFRALFLNGLQQGEQTQRKSMPHVWTICKSNESMREFSRHISRSGVGNLPGIFPFPGLIPSPRLSEPWLLKSGLPWLPRVAHWKDVRKWEIQESYNLSTWKFQILRFCFNKLPWKITSCWFGELWHDTQFCLPPELRTKDGVCGTEVKKGPGWEKFGEVHFKFRP